MTMYVRFGAMIITSTVDDVSYVRRFARCAF